MKVPLPACMASAPKSVASASQPASASANNRKAKRAAREQLKQLELREDTLPNAESLSSIPGESEIA